MSLNSLAHLNPASVLDCGANCGHWYREAKSLWPDARYLLIEGNPACRPYLEETGAPFEMAYLGDTRRTVDFYKRKGGGTDTGNSYYRELTPFFADDQIEIERVHLVPLSEVACADAQWELIKLDCQGAELDIIMGGIEIVARAKWMLLEVAIEDYNSGAPQADVVFSFMAGIGFKDRQFIADICHPISRQIVQRDVLFSKQSTGGISQP